MDPQLGHFGPHDHFIYHQQWLLEGPIGPTGPDLSSGPGAGGGVGLDYLMNLGFDSPEFRKISEERHLLLLSVVLCTVTVGTPGPGSGERRDHKRKNKQGH